MKVRIDITMGLVMAFILILITYSTIQLFIDTENVPKYIPAILIGSSALLASLTVMRSIENTNKIEEQKSKRDLFQIRLKYYNTLHEFYAKLFAEAKINYDIVNQLNKDLRRSELLFDEKIGEYIDNLISQCFDACKDSSILEGLPDKIYRMNEKVGCSEHPDVEALKEQKKELIHKQKDFFFDAKNKKEELESIFDKYLNLKKH